MNIPVTITRTTDGLLKIWSQFAGSTIGSAPDDNAQILVFTRPAHHASDKLVLRFKTSSGNFGPYNPHSYEEVPDQNDTYRLPKYLTSHPNLFLQILFENEDTTEASNMLTFYFREGILPDVPDKSYVTTEENRIPYIYESADGVFTYHSAQDGTDKVLIGQPPDDGRPYARTKGGWVLMPIIQDPFEEEYAGRSYVTLPVAPLKIINVFILEDGFVKDADWTNSGNYFN